MRVIYLTKYMADYISATYQQSFLLAFEKSVELFIYGPGYELYSMTDNISEISEKAGWGTEFDAVVFGHSWLVDGPEGSVDPLHIEIDVDRPVFFFINKEYARLEEKIDAIDSYHPVNVFSHHHELDRLVRSELEWEVDFVPFAADPERFSPAKKRTDLFFSGILQNPTHPDSQPPDRVEIQSQLFRVLFGIRFGSRVRFNVFWNSFTTNPLIDRINRFRRLDDAEYASEIGASRIVLNSLSPVNLLGTRIFETMLSGAVCLSPAAASFAKFLKHDWNCYFYESPEQFVETVEYLLEHPEKLRSIAETARNDAIENHTWDNRAAQVRETIAKWA